jgi:hypothetical protein
VRRKRREVEEKGLPKVKKLRKLSIEEGGIEQALMQGIHHMRWVYKGGIRMIRARVGIGIAGSERNNVPSVEVIIRKFNLFDS